MHDFRKNTYNAEEKLIDELNKCSRENNNLVKWLKLYDEQLNNHQQEIYNLNIKLYFSSQQTPQQNLLYPSRNSRNNHNSRNSNRHQHLKA